jgi:hypothetical protein
MRKTLLIEDCAGVRKLSGLLEDDELSGFRRRENLRIRTDDWTTRTEDRANGEETKRYFTLQDVMVGKHRPKPKKHWRQL